MTSVQLTVVLSIVGALVSIAGIYFLARSNARDNVQAQQTRTDNAVAVERQRGLDAAAALQLQLNTANQTIERRDRQIEAKDRRIEALEDELRRAR